jgi:hypothetical protein
MEDIIQPFEFLHSLLGRLSLVIMWLACAVFHLALIVVFLTAAWFWQIAPETVEGFAIDLFQRMHGATLLAAVGLLGVSGGLALYWYIRFWRKIYGALVTPFLFRDIDDAFKRKQQPSSD